MNFAFGRAWTRKNRPISSESTESVGNKISNGIRVIVYWHRYWAARSPTDCALAESTSIRTRCERNKIWRQHDPNVTRCFWWRKLYCNCTKVCCRFYYIFRGRRCCCWSSRTTTPSFKYYNWTDVNVCVAHSNECGFVTLVFDTHKIQNWIQFPLRNVPRLW